jgi:hypothetical protein
MKKVWLKALFTVIVVLFVLTLVPSTIFAQNAGMRIGVGRPGEVSTFYLSATGSHGQNWYFGIIKFEGSIEEFWDLTEEEQEQYLVETYGGIIGSDDWSTEISVTLPAGSYYAGFLIGDEPIKENIVDMERFVVTDRRSPMTCWQIYVNEAGNFEFIFWWEYANNNWVKIYDMDGNLVYEVDFLYGEPCFEVDLPDGMYTVKTYHDGFETPIQEFIIGKQ